MKSKLLWSAVIVVVLIGAYAVWAHATARWPFAAGVQYRNTQYGFSISLPESWRGYTIVTQQDDIWDIASGTIIGHFPRILVRHPLWTAQHPRQDIPIDIFTFAQWDKIVHEQYSVSAAPFPPLELVRNATYVFAVPARYNYAYQDGWQEVQSILDAQSVRALY